MGARSVEGVELVVAVVTPAATLAVALQAAGVDAPRLDPDEVTLLVYSLARVVDAPAVYIARGEDAADVVGRASERGGVHRF